MCLKLRKLSDSKLESGYPLHSHNLSSMMYGSDLGSICHIHELQKKYGRDFLEYISAHYLLCSNQLFDFFLLDKSSMVNDVPESKCMLESSV
jgi:hypothetical protein